MTELAERVEAVGGADRGLDRAIWLSLGNVEPDAWNMSPAPTYTASIDAAMTLVPEGLTEWEIGRSTRDPRFGQYQARICLLTAEQDPEELGPQAIANGATPALALCAAALRARKD